MRKTVVGNPTWGPLLAMTLMAGCDSRDERLQQLTRESLNRQAEQNRQIGLQSQQVAEATKQLIDAHAKGREELIGIQKEIQTERATVARQYESLHQEHKQLATDQQALSRAQLREPLIANAIQSAAVLVAALVPLIVACYLLKAVARDRDEDSENAELLVTELISDVPLSLPPSEPTIHKLEEDSVAPAGPLVRLPARVTGPPDTLVRSAPARAVIVVEGRHDIEFLKRISRMLHRHDAQLPDLDRLEQENEVIFIPAGGGALDCWIKRFAGLRLREFHLYDREVFPLTLERQQTVELINQRTGCKALLTGKRAIENYLHPDAILRASGIEVVVDDECDVPELFASANLLKIGGAVWSKLPRRARRRVRDHAKRLLNTVAVEKMTPQLLQERDPNGDVIGWLTALAEMLRDTPA